MANRTPVHALLVDVCMQPLMIPATQPLRLSTTALGLADLSLSACPRAYCRQLLASFPDCNEIQKTRPACQPLLLLVVYKTSMSMASFSPDTGAPPPPATCAIRPHDSAEAERESIFKRHLEWCEFPHCVQVCCAFFVTKFTPYVPGFSM